MSIRSVSAINNNIADMAEVAGAQSPEPSEGSHDTNRNRPSAPTRTPTPPRTTQLAISNNTHAIRPLKKTRPKASVSYQKKLQALGGQASR